MEDYDVEVVDETEVVASRQDDLTCELQRSIGRAVGGSCGVKQTGDCTKALKQETNLFEATEELPLRLRLLQLALLGISPNKEVFQHCGKLSDNAETPNRERIARFSYCFVC